VPASDPMRERIEAFNQARGGGVAVHRAGRGYTLTSQHTGAPLARLKPTGDAEGASALVDWPTLGRLRAARHRNRNVSTTLI